MKRVKTWVLILAMAGPAVSNFSCSSMLLAEARDSALSATGLFIEEAILNLLDELLLPDGSGDGTT